MTVKINSLELENIKRIKAVKLVPSGNGLTILGGKNGQVKPAFWMRLPGRLVGKDINLLNRSDKDLLLRQFCI